MFAGTSVLAFFLKCPKAVGQHHVGWHGACQPPCLLIMVLHHRPHGGPVAWRGRKAAADGNVPAFPCLKVMTAAAVVIEGMRHGANDAVLVGDRGNLRQVFTDQEFRGSAGDGLERPANLFRSIGFQVPCFKLAGASEEHQKDDRLRPGGGLTDRFGGQQLRNGKAEQSHAACGEYLSPGKAITGSARIAINREHGRRPDFWGGVPGRWEE